LSPPFLRYYFGVAMDIDSIRDFCLKLPHTTEKIQWGGSLVFKTGEKMYAVVRLDPGSVYMSFKCSDEDFGELIERPGIIPAPYIARAHWVALENPNSLSRAEIEHHLSKAHALIFAKLPRKTQARLAAAAPKRVNAARSSRTAKPPRRKSS